MPNQDHYDNPDAPQDEDNEDIVPSDLTRITQIEGALWEGEESGVFAEDDASLAKMFLAIDQLFAQPEEDELHASQEIADILAMVRTEALQWREDVYRVETIQQHFSWLLLKDRYSNHPEHRANVPAPRPVVIRQFTIVRQSHQLPRPYTAAQITPPPAQRYLAPQHDDQHVQITRQYETFYFLHIVQLGIFLLAAIVIGTGSRLIHINLNSLFGSLWLLCCGGACAVASGYIVKRHAHPNGLMSFLCFIGSITF